jgi:hypothetical protein
MLELNQQKTLRFFFKCYPISFKVDKQTQKPIITNKNNNTQAIFINNNGRRILIESTSSDSDIANFEKRFNNQEQHTNQMAQLKLFKLFCQKAKKMQNCKRFSKCQNFIN